MAIIAYEKIAGFQIPVNNVFSVEVTNGIRGFTQLNDTVK